MVEVSGEQKEGLLSLEFENKMFYFEFWMVLRFIYTEFVNFYLYEMGKLF